MANPKTIRERRASMFEDEGRDLDASFDSNSHCETEYEDMRRLPTQTVCKRTDREYDGQYEMVDQSPPLSARVRNQVLSSIGERAGTMTYASQLDRSRGVGTLGNTGGVQERGSGHFGEDTREMGNSAVGIPYDGPPATSSRRRRS